MPGPPFDLIWIGKLSPYRSLHTRDYFSRRSAAAASVSR